VAKKKSVNKKSASAKPTATGRVANRKASTKKSSTKKATMAKKAAATRKPTGTGAKSSEKRSSQTEARAVPRKKVPRKAAPKTDLAALVSSPDHEPPTPEELRKVKTGLTKRDLDNYRQLLLEKRSEILGDVESLQMDARNGAGASISYEHMADTGSDNYEQEFTLGLVASEQKLLSEIHEALLRLQNGCYGVCIETGVPIGKPRLDAKPWARYCIEVAREKERRGQM
jgi:DnaK suppressor protein